MSFCRKGIIGIWYNLKGPQETDFLLAQYKTYINFGVVTHRLNNHLARQHGI